MTADTGLAAEDMAENGRARVHRGRPSRTPGVSHGGTEDEESRTTRFLIRSNKLMLLLFTVMKKTCTADDSRRVKSFGLDKLNVRCQVTQTEKSGRQRGRNG